MTRKIVVILGLFVIAFAAGCGDDSNKNKTEFSPTDPDIQAARMKIAEARDVYKETLEDLGAEAQKTMMVGGLDDDAREQRKADMMKKGRDSGRVLVDSVKAALDGVPEAVRKANAQDYLELVFYTPVYIIEAEQSQQGRQQQDTPVFLIQMDNQNYGLTPDRSKWYTDIVVNIIDAGMKDETKAMVADIIQQLVQYGDMRQNEAMINQIIQKDPKGDFWVSLGQPLDNWNAINEMILQFLGEYERAEAIVKDLEVSLDGKALEALQTGAKQMQKDKEAVQREEEKRKEDQEKTAEDKLLPRATIVFLGEDGKEKGEVEIILLEDDAFNAVANFISLVRSGYYTEKEIDFVSSMAVAGGSKFGVGVGSPDYTIKQEQSSRGILRGTLAYGKGNCGMFQIYKRQADKDKAGVMPFAYIVKGIDVIDVLQPGDQIAEIKIDKVREGSVYEPVKEKKDQAPSYGGGDSMPYGAPMGPSGR